MASRITPEQIEEMVRLYAELKTYSAVAKKMGISPGTVSRYIKDRQNVKTYTSDVAADIPQPIDISQISGGSIATFSTLTPQETESYNAWIKEFHQ